MVERKVIHKGNIGNALHSVAPDHITTTADEIFDEERQEYQQDINEGVGRFIDNPEFIKVEIDSDKHIIRAIKADGTEYLGAGIEVHGNINTDGAVTTILDSPEFSKVYLDNDGRILYGVQRDGNFYFGAGIPRQIIDYIEIRIADLSLDEYEAIVSFLDGLEFDEDFKTLRELLNEKVDKEEGKSLIDAEYANGVRYIENPEFAEVKVDNEDRILEAIMLDGTKLLPAGVKVIGTAEYDGATIKTVDNPEFAGVWLDGEDKILFGVQTDGNFLFGCGIPRQVKEYIEQKIDELSLDEYESIVNFIGDYLNNTTLEELLSKKVDGEYVDNPEFIEVKTDADDKLTEATRKDGTKVIYGDLEVLGSLDIQGVAYKVVSNPEWLKVVLDSEDRIICGIKADGRFVVYIADFLDDIEAIKARLEELDVFSVIENPEFVYVQTGNEGKILFGINTDGEPYFGVGCPKQIKQYIEEKIAELSLDELIAGIQAQLATKVDKEEGKSLIDAEYASSQSTTDSSEHIRVTTDSEGKILAGRTPDGAAFENVGFTTPKVSIDGATIKNIEDLEGRHEVTIDSEDKIISYRKDDGTLVENVGIETSKIKTEEIQLSEEGKIKLIKDTNPYIRIDRIDIISTLLTVSGNTINPLNNSKNEVGDVDSPDVLFKYTSKNGGFTDNCVIAYQGNSSIAWDKKGFSVDLANKHRFKDWIEHDSFNIKSYATDWMHVREYIGTTIYEQMMQHRPIGHRRPWEVYNDFKDDNYAILAPSSALGHSDQHPVELYINGNYWGLYSISLKKKKENYEMKKNNAKHIMLDADGFSVAGDTFSWHGAEIRFPKEDKNKNKLLDKDLHKYDGDNPTELLGADNPNYDPNNSTHVFCNTVKQNILTFYQFMHNINENTTKEEIEAHWNVEEFIDSFLHANFVYDIDKGGKNTLYCTWDGEVWSPVSYDFDLTFGCSYSYNGMVQGTAYHVFEKYSQPDGWNVIPGCGHIKSLYQTEIEARYKELRDAGIFTVDNVVNIINQWMLEVGEDVYKDDLERWDGMYGNLGTHVLNGTEGTEFYISQKAFNTYMTERISVLDAHFNYNN